MKQGLILSGVLHFLLGAFFILPSYWDASFQVSSTHSKPEIIQAQLVDGTKIAEQKKRQQEKAKAQQQEIEQQQRAKLLKEKKQTQEKKIAVEKEKKRLAKIAQDKRKKAQFAKEKLAKAKQTKQREEEKKRLAEMVRKAAAARLAEKKSQQQEGRLRDKVIGKYIGLIQQKVKRNWIRPFGSQKQTATMGIKLLPDGAVLNVRVVKSSGSRAFDDSVIDALWKAGELPIPKIAKYRKMFTGEELMMNFGG